MKELPGEGFEVGNGAVRVHYSDHPDSPIAITTSGRVLGSFPVVTKDPRAEAERLAEMLEAVIYAEWRSCSSWTLQEWETGKIGGAGFVDLGDCVGIDLLEASELYVEAEKDGRRVRVVQNSHLVVGADTGDSETMAGSTSPAAWLPHQGGQP